MAEGRVNACHLGATPAELPFGGAYRPTGDLKSIVGEFLADGEPGLVRWAEPADVGDGEPESDPALPPFPVWTRDIGRS